MVIRDNASGLDSRDKQHKQVLRLSGHLAGQCPGVVGADIMLRLPVPESRSQIQTSPAKTQGEGRKG